MFIEVDGEELAQSARSIERALSIVESIISGASSVVADGQESGRADVTQTLQSFSSAWKYGLSCLGQDGHQLAKMLGTAGAKYLAVEQAIVDAATP